MLFVFSAVTVLTSCEDIQDNSPAVQADIDGIFFRANDARGSMNANGTWDIRGFSADEELRIHLPAGPIGTYELGGNSQAYATFRDQTGSTYTTLPQGRGTVVLTDRCVSCGTMSGTFNFQAVIAGVDTISVSRGVFFDVRFAGEDDGPDPGNAGTFAAQVNGNTFSPVSVSAVNSGNSILIAGADANRTIIVRVTTAAVPGTYDIPSDGYTAAVSEGGVTEEGTSGTIVIAEHNTSTKMISGTFAFETDSNTVSQGQFNVSYE